MYRHVLLPLSKKKEREEGERRNEIRLPDIIVLLGNPVRCQTEL